MGFDLLLALLALTPLLAQGPKHAAAISREATPASPPRRAREY
jgi:hypothetical protein